MASQSLGVDDWWRKLIVSYETSVDAYNCDCLQLTDGDSSYVMLQLPKVEDQKRPIIHHIPAPSGKFPFHSEKIRSGPFVGLLHLFVFSVA